MLLSKGATIAVADGEKFKLFHNVGDEAGLKLEPVAHEAIDTLASVLCSARVFSANRSLVRASSSSTCRRASSARRASSNWPTVLSSGCKNCTSATV